MLISSVMIAGIIALMLAPGLQSAAAPSLSGDDSTATQHEVTVAGAVDSAGTALAGLDVVLYQAGSSSTSPATVLGTSQTDADSQFSITVDQPAADAILYLVATETRPGSRAGQPFLNLHRGPIRLAAILGDAGNAPDDVVINEVTTIATAWAMAQFMSGTTIAGPAPGMPTAAAISTNLADVTTGEVATYLATAPNGPDNESWPTFNTLANILHACVSRVTDAACEELFRFATPPGEAAPTDTLQAALNIAHFPVQHTEELYQLSLVSQPYTPALDEQPNGWAIFLKHVGNGMEFDGPGNIAIDKNGNLWITNNYVYDSNPGAPGLELLAITPTGDDLPGAPYSGGGIFGAGFGISFDPSDNLWVGNFGFGLPGEGLSVSKFDLSGVPLSPDTGFTNGNVNGPQGTVSDKEGNIWIANFHSDSISIYRHGDPHEAINIANIGLSDPFDIAIDTHGNAWVSSRGNDLLFAFNPYGRQLAGSPFSGNGLKAPMGVAVDSQDNIIVANNNGHSVSMFGPDGTPYPNSPFELPGEAFGPWGINVDGNDNIYVAGFGIPIEGLFHGLDIEVFFGGEKLGVLCGSRPDTCPAGSDTGDALSPENGYTSGILTRLTAVEIDSAGSVWVANNYKTRPIEPPNEGGDSLLQFIGMAAPVRTPLIGPSQTTESEHLTTITATFETGDEINPGAAWSDGSGYHLRGAEYAVTVSGDIEGSGQLTYNTDENPDAQDAWGTLRITTDEGSWDGQYALVTADGSDAARMLLTGRGNAGQNAILLDSLIALSDGSMSLSGKRVTLDKPIGGVSYLADVCIAGPDEVFGGFSMRGVHDDSGTFSTSFTSIGFLDDGGVFLNATLEGELGSLEIFLIELVTTGNGLRGSFMTLGGNDTYTGIYGLGRALGSAIQSERCPLGIGLHQSMFGESMY